MDGQPIYVVVGESGEYSGRYESPICAFTNELVARACIAKWQAAATAYRVTYDDWCKARRGDRPQWNEEFDLWEVYRLEGVPLYATGMPPAAPSPNPEAAPASK